METGVDIVNMDSDKMQQELTYTLQTMKINHIAIPFDEVNIFENQEKYQNFLIQTLLYSTKVVLYHNTHKVKCLLVLTKHSLWLEQLQNHHKQKIQLKKVEQIIKAEEHPELVIVTNQLEDNLRISIANQERCHNFISALSFYFTYLCGCRKTLKATFVKQNSLLFFERTAKQKKRGPKLNLERYTHQQIRYIEPNDSPDIFGKLLIQKLHLTKQIYSENSHLVHIAKVNEQELYLCHTIDKIQQYCSVLLKHINLDFIHKLVYVRKLEYKIQLFFEFMPSLKPNLVQIETLFQFLFETYDKVKKNDENAVITLNMICRSNEDQKLYLREFRYDFLVFENELSRFLYTMIRQQKNEKDYFANKMYNIGLVLYHYIFGRSLFDHEDIQILAHFKFTLSKVPFPEYLNINCSKTIKDFIEDCVLGRIEDIKALQKMKFVKRYQVKTQ